MKTCILKDNDSVLVARRPLTITITGGTDASLTLTALGGGIQVEQNRGGNPRVVVLPSPREHTTIRLLPRTGGLFPDGTIVSLELRTSKAATGEQDQVLVRDVEISGLPFRDLVAIDLPGSDSALSVTALDTVRDPHVDPLAKKARAAARAHLGIDRRRDPVQVLVAVDMSFSMTPALRDGSIKAVLEVITGISQVIDADRVPEVFLLDERHDQLPAVEIKDLAVNAVAKIRERQLGCGFRSSPPDFPVPANSVTYVVTDGVPADVAALEGAHKPEHARHLLIVNGPVTESVGMPMTVLPVPPEGVLMGDYLLAHYEDLSRLVASMMVGLDDGAR